MANRPQQINPPAHIVPGSETDARLEELNHRWLNDIHLMTGMLRNCARDASQETRDLIADAIDRIMVLVENRRHLRTDAGGDLCRSLRWVCEALNGLSANNILVSLLEPEHPPPMRMDQIDAITLTVNELVTNAIKHGFDDDGGQVSVSVTRGNGNMLIVAVEDNGVPFVNDHRSASKRDGGGIGMVRRFISAAGGLFISPTAPSKRYELRFAATST